MIVADGMGGAAAAGEVASRCRGPLVACSRRPTVIKKSDEAREEDVIDRRHPVLRDAHAAVMEPPGTTGGWRAWGRR